MKNKEISFSHIVNTTTNPKFELAQSITIQSMLNAKQKSTSNVELLHTSFENEYQSIDGFSYAGDLKKSAKDVKRFNINRRLPLIKEIFDNGCLAATNQYFIYTNIDISLMPDFYNQIAQLINQGYDCIIVNRKNIDDSKYRTIEQIEDMYADSGEPHVGMDCFVFKKDILSAIELRELLVGVKSVDVGIYINIVALSDKVYHEKERKLTFHIGEDGNWTKGQFVEYNKHNKNVIETIISRLKNKRIYSSIFEKRQDATRYISWKNTVSMD